MCGHDFRHNEGVSMQNKMALIHTIYNVDILTKSVKALLLIKLWGEYTLNDSKVFAMFMPIKWQQRI